jgi:hypothetical protein
LLDTSNLKINGDCNLFCKIKAPPRVKNPLWCICCRCIPTRVNLRSRGVNCTDICPLCNNNAEDIYQYLFFRCPSSNNMWSMCSFYPLIAAMHNDKSITMQLI